MPKLVITDDDGVREVPLRSGDTLGRVAENAVQLKVAEASRRHCEFSEEKGLWFVEDLGSSNGTLVNGRRVTKFELQDGDVIQIGTVSLRFLETEVEEEPDLEDFGDDEISLEDDVFIVLGGAKREGEVIKLPEGRVSIGRKMRNLVVLKDASVSGEHAELVREGSQVTVRDLGSSNGTFVDGRKVMEAELSSGDELRFGTVPAVFGVGDPKDFAVVSAGGAAGDDAVAATSAISQFDDGADPTFELHDIPQRKESPVWNLLAVVMILALGGGAAWLFLNQSKRGGDGAADVVAAENNLIPAAHASFEVEESEDEELPEDGGEGWDRATLDEGSEMGEVSQPVRSGEQAYSVERYEAAGAPALAILSQRVSITSAATYEFSGWVDAPSEETAPFIAITWMESRPGAEGDEETIVLSRDRIFARGGGDDWAEIKGLVTAPEGASTAQIGVGVAGTGSAVFDDLALSPATPAPGRAQDLGAYKANLTAMGALRLSRYRRFIFDGLGVRRDDGGKTKHHDALLVPVSADAEGLLMTLRDGGGDIRVSMTKSGESLRFAMRGSGMSKVSGIEIPLTRGDSGDFQVTVLDGEEGQLLETPFGARAATALLVGNQTDRAMIRFKDAGEQPMRPQVSLVLEDDRPIVTVETKGAQEVLLDFQLTFTDERRAARDLKVQAEVAARDGKSGEAIRLCEKLMARYPFEEQIIAEASKLHQDLTEEGQKLLEGQRQRLEDALFFRTLERETALDQELTAAAARFGGTPLEREFGGLKERLASELSKWRAPRLDRRARRSFIRAQDYMETKKNALAELFFTEITEHQPDTDWADQAQTLLQRVKAARKSDGGSR